MRLILVRHGETEDNKKSILQGHSSVNLSTEGLKQAKKVAVRLKDKTIDYIYSIDLKRAQDTAKEIKKHHPNTSIKYIKKLRERDVGEFQGEHKDKFGWGDDAFIDPKEGESFQALHKRAKDLLEETISKHNKETILFVCHSGIGRAIIRTITGIKSRKGRTYEHLGNTSISIFEVNQDGKYRIIRLNCSKHLEEIKA